MSWMQDTCSHCTPNDNKDESQGRTVDPPHSTSVQPGWGWGPSPRRAGRESAHCVAFIAHFESVSC